ncbi:MAG: CU044_2847 family protein [Dermatophilaceae bacterium]
MTDFVEVGVGRDSTLLVESSTTELAAPAGRLRDLGAAAAQDFEAAMESVRTAAQSAVMRIKGSADVPDEITLQFAIQLAAEAGVVVARTGATANMTISLKWKTGEDSNNGNLQVIDSSDMGQG